MFDCTGESYPNEGLHLRSIEGWHGKYGHLNVVKRDHDSVCTHYGRHDRCVAYTNGNTLTVRVDHVWRLGNPSIKEMLDIARHDGWKGRWVLDNVEYSDDRSSTWFNFIK